MRPIANAVSGGEIYPRSPGQGPAERFRGVAPDETARKEIEGALLACAARRRALDALWDGSEEDKRVTIEGHAPTNFVQVGRRVVHHDAFLIPYPIASDDRGDAAFRQAEPMWRT